MRLKMILMLEMEKRSDVQKGVALFIFVCLQTLTGRYLANNLILFHILSINCQYLKGTSQGLRHHYKLVLRSENKDYEPICLSLNEMDSFHIIGKVVWVSRDVM